jgi:hypothetical protein
MWTSGSGHGTVFVPCGQGKKLYGSVKDTGFIHYLTDYRPLKILCAPWSYVNVYFT